MSKGLISRGSRPIRRGPCRSFPPPEQPATVPQVAKRRGRPLDELHEGEPAGSRYASEKELALRRLERRREARRRQPQRRRVVLDRDGPTLGRAAVPAAISVQVERGRLPRRQAFRELEAP